MLKFAEGCSFIPHSEHMTAELRQTLFFFVLYECSSYLVVETPVRIYECVSKSFRTGRPERELQMVQLSVTRCDCIAILWVSLVSFAAITLCVASQRVFIVVGVYFVTTQSGNFWIHPRRQLRAAS
jgi:hypothetical protein